jgi:hypothetical protein
MDHSRREVLYARFGPITDKQRTRGDAGIGGELAPPLAGEVNCGLPRVSSLTSSE